MKGQINMKKIIKSFVAIAFALVLLLSVLPIAGADESSPQIPLLRIGLGTDEHTLNPHTYRFEAGFNLTHLIWDSLMVRDENLNPMPWLAEEITVSDDGLVYTFRIHEGVTFHDGMPLTSADVAFTYLETRDNPTARSRFQAPMQIISEVNIIDELTVEMVLSEPSAEFLIRPISEVGILPQHLWENIEQLDEADIRVGSGAYMLADLTIDEFYVLEANPNFWNGRAVAEAIYMPVISDPTALFTALRAGELDATMPMLLPELINEFDTVPSLSTISGAGFASTLVYFNNEVYPFNLTDFRLALTWATDVQEIVDIIMLGNATYGSLGFTHPSLPSFNPNVNRVGFDLDIANQMLDDLGFDNRNADGTRLSDDGDPLEFTILVYSTNPIRIRIAEFLQGWWEEIGLDIEISAMDPDTVDDLVWPGFAAENGRDFDVVMWGWGAGTMGSAQRTLENMHSDLTLGNSNIGAFANSELDAVLEELIAEIDPERRIELMMQIQYIYSHDPGAITLYYPDIVFAYNPEMFSDWTFRLGEGIVHNLSLIDTAYTPTTQVDEPDEEVAPTPDENDDSETSEPPPTPEATEPEIETGDGGGGIPIWAIVLVIVAVPVAIIAIVMVRKKMRLK